MEAVSRTVFSLVVLLAAVLTSGCGASGEANAGGGGSDRPEKVRFAVSDLEGAEQLQREFGAFQEKFSEVLGTEVELFPVSSLTAATTAIESDRVDLVLTGPSEYVVMRERAGAVPVWGIHRPGYRSAIVVQPDSGIESVRDLEGKTIAASVPGATSEHIGQAAMLAEAGLDAQNDVEWQFVGDLGRYRTFADGQVPAVAINSADYEPLMVDQFGLSREEAPIIAESPHLGPDVFVANPDTLSDAYIAELRTKLRENGDALLRSITGTGETDYASNYADARIVADVKDSDFDFIRKGYRAIGQDYGKLPGQ